MMKKIFLATIVSLIFLAPVKATHFMGGEITWECIKSGPTQGMYIFRLKLYRDCNGTTILPSQTITVYNHPSVFSIPVSLVPGSPSDISPDCDPVNSGNVQISCNTFQQGSVEEYVYESLPINLPGIPPAGGWHFTWDDCCRNGAITNGFANQGFTLRAVMYSYSTSGVPQNTSPCFDSSPYFNSRFPLVTQGRELCLL